MSSSLAVSIGGCDNYVPLEGDVVVCASTVTPIAGQGVIAPDSNTTNNNISVTIQAGTFLDINGSTIGLGSSSTVVNDGRLNTQSFTNGYGISAGVNGRSQLGGSSITNNGEITTEGSNAHGIIISADRVTGGAGNTIINTGLIQTAGTGDGIRLFTTARGVTNQITNSGSIVTAAAVAGIRLESTESTDTISNSGTITTSGADGVGILVLNTLNRPTVSNSGTITTTGSAGYPIYGDGAMALINSGTLTSDVYVMYFEDGTRSAGSNSVTLKAGSNITGGLRFNPSKTSETLVFDGLVEANFDNNVLNVNNISALQSADVTMNAASYSFGASQINVDQTSQLTISAPIGDAAIATSITKLGNGVLTLSGQSTYTGGTTLVEGTLALYGRLASGVQIGLGTLLGGTGTINGDVVSRGIIQPRLNGSRSTLTIVGNYTGENGTFASTLEGTAPNAIVADQLAIVGAGSMASGSTTITVSDPSGVLGQPTTGDGILLVGFSDGATGADTAFRSDRIAAGAYEYELVRGGQSSAQDWYLRADNNAPAPPMPVTPQTAQREEVALYPILPSLARQYLMSMTGTLDERRGAPDSLPKERVAWARVIGQHNEISPPSVNNGPGLKANDWGLQIGVDFVRADLDSGHWRMGPVLTIGRSTRVRLTAAAVR